MDTRTCQDRQPSDHPSSSNCSSSKSNCERERIRNRMKMVIGQLEGILQELKEVAKELREVGTPQGVIATGHGSCWSQMEVPCPTVCPLPLGQGWGEQSQLRTHNPSARLVCNKDFQKERGEKNSCGL